MRKKNLKPTAKRISARTHRHVFLLNDEEERAFERYIQKYHVQNQSKFIRETIVVAIMHQFEEDHPTLF